MKLSYYKLLAYLGAVLGLGIFIIGFCYLYIGNIFDGIVNIVFGILGMLLSKTNIENYKKRVLHDRAKPVEDREE